MRFRQFIVFALAAVLSCAAWAQSAPEPVNPAATPEARALLAYFYSISGKATIAGQHNYPNVGARWTDMAYDLTAKYPGLFGGDFGFSAGEDKDSVLARPAMIAEVERQYRNGAVITLTWHEVRPTDDEPVTFHDSVQGHLTDAEWKELLTPGSPLNLRWRAQVDVIAGYLRQLRDAHVPVLFRPYHEMNGNWFWWGGRPGKDGSQALYRQIYDRFVNVHHLDNLVWVWNVNAPNGRNAGSIEDYYPGAQYRRPGHHEHSTASSSRSTTPTCSHWPAINPSRWPRWADCPARRCSTKQPRWTYFMCWSEFIQEHNPVDLVECRLSCADGADPRGSAPLRAAGSDPQSYRGAPCRRA